jgi:hypothetical protein
LQSGASNRTSNTTNATNATDCTDYYYYMNLTLAEKIARFEEIYCSPVGLTASDVMVRKIEQLADADHNGVLSCSEFTSAYANVGNMTTVDSFCTNINMTFTSTAARPSPLLLDPSRKRTR